MSDQNSVQRGVILAKRNSMGTIPCHLTALAQVFKQTSRSRERLQTSVSPRRRAKSLPEPSATAQPDNCFVAHLQHEHTTRRGRRYTGEWAWRENTRGRATCVLILTGVDGLCVVLMRVRIGRCHETQLLVSQHLENEVKGFPGTLG